MKHRSIYLPLLIGLSVLAASAWAIAYPRLHRTSLIIGHLQRAQEAQQQGDTQALEKECTAVLKIDPKNAGATELLADHCIRIQDWNDGIIAFQRLEQVAPKTPHILCRMATCYLRAGDELTAYKLSEEEIQKDKNCLTALGIAAALLAKVGQNDQRLVYLRRMAKIVPHDWDVERLLAEALVDTYHYDELQPLAESMRALRPDDPEVCSLLGVCYLSQVQQPQGAEQAVTLFRKSLELNPLNAGARLGLGRAALLLRQPKKAVFELEEAVRLAPNNPRIYFLLDQAYRMAGLPARAKIARTRFEGLQKLAMSEGLLRTRCNSNPGVPEYPHKLGLLLIKVGEPDKAIVYLEQAIRLNPGDRKARAALDQIQHPRENTPTPAPASQENHPFGFRASTAQVGNSDTSP